MAITPPLQSDYHNEYTLLENHVIYPQNSTSETDMKRLLDLMPHLKGDEGKKIINHFIRNIADRLSQNDYQTLLYKIATEFYEFIDHSNCCSFIPIWLLSLALSKGPNSAIEEHLSRYEIAILSHSFVYHQQNVAINSLVDLLHTAIQGKGEYQKVLQELSIQVQNWAEEGRADISRSFLNAIMRTYRNNVNSVHIPTEILAHDLSRMEQIQGNLSKTITVTKWQYFRNKFHLLKKSSSNAKDFSLCKRV